MFHLTAPLGLFALGALLVPILIHLVRRPLKVVRLGSLQFLRTERLSVRSPRWHELLLLILRCALLALLALSLAGAQWQPANPPAVRWLLLAPDATLDPAARAEWARRHEEGFESRRLATGFPKFSPSAGHGPVGAAPESVAAFDAWSLLREADARLSAGSHAIVFGPVPASHFRGARPTLSHLQVEWRVTPGAASPVSPVPAAPVRVALHASADREDDARYVRAALHAIGGVVLTPEAPDWIFHLGDGPLSPALAASGARLVTDAPNTGRPLAVTRTFDAGPVTLRLRQRIPAPPGEPVLLDSAGDPLLTTERRGAAHHWRFALRFHPDWSDWTLGSAFPAWWQAQFRPAATGGQTIAPEQAAPRYAPAPAPAAPTLPSLGQIDLRPWCWFAATALFLIERALSMTARRGKAPG